MKEIEHKKHEMAHKMKHKHHKGSEWEKDRSFAKKQMKYTVEGDEDRFHDTEDDFSKKDIRKEKKARKEKVQQQKHDWES